MKDTNKDEPNEETYMVKSGKVSNMKFSYPQDTSPSILKCGCQPEVHPSLGVQSLLRVSLCRHG